MSDRKRVGDEGSINEGLIEELARLFGNEMSAHALLAAAAIPPHKLRPFAAMTAEEFWGHVCGELNNGKVDGVDVDRLLREALRKYPGNRKLKAHIAHASAAATPLARDDERGPRLEALAQLLCELFNATEMRHWVQLLPNGRQLHTELPSEGASPQTLAREIVMVLDRHGRIDSALFDSLRKLRPDRRSDIERVRASFEM